MILNNFILNLSLPLLFGCLVAGFEATIGCVLFAFNHAKVVDFAVDDRGQRFFNAAAEVAGVDILCQFIAVFIPEIHERPELFDVFTSNVDLIRTDCYSCNFKAFALNQNLCFLLVDFQTKLFNNRPDAELLEL